MYQVERFEAEIPVEDYLEGYVAAEEFLEFCRRCPRYGNSWACPPLPFPAETFWRKFETLSLIARKISFVPGTAPEEGRALLKQIKEQMSQELYEMEQIWPGSCALSAGSCSLCRDECRRAAGKPCENPEKMRYSIEALGGNVGLTVRKLMGIQLEWMEEGKLPSYFVLVGGLLKNPRV